MVIVATLYVLILWIIFRFTPLPFNWPWRIASAIGGVAILAVFIALLNTLTPSGRVAVLGRVVEVTPDIAGQVTSIPVQRNQLVKKGSVLFEIQRVPFETKVRQLQAALAEGVQKVERMKVDVASADADVAAVAAQLGPATKRRDDVTKLTLASTASQFQLQDLQKQVTTLSAQMDAATAKAQGARLALGSTIDGDHTSTAQLAAQLDQAQWDLDQTTVRAPSDGYVTAMALTVGTRVVPFRAAMSFIVANETSAVGFFPQNGFARIKPGARVMLSLANQPGRVFETIIVETLSGVGEGQIAVAGTLARVGQVGLTGDFPALIATPPSLDPDLLRLGMAGTATVVASDAGPIGVLAGILQWVRAYALYL